MDLFDLFDQIKRDPRKKRGTALDQPRRIGKRVNAGSQMARSHLDEPAWSILSDSYKRFGDILLIVPGPVLRKRDDALRYRTFGGSPSDQSGAVRMHPGNDRSMKLPNKDCVVTHPVIAYVLFKDGIRLPNYQEPGGNQRAR
jgi:hypothetical protein